jgi:hypothetical protein
MDQSEKVTAARARLAEKFGDGGKLGGKGTQRRTHKVLFEKIIQYRSPTKPQLIRIPNLKVS